MKRVCADPDCDTFLSRYSQSASCSQHGGGPATIDQAYRRAEMIGRAIAILHRPPEWADEAACKGRDVNTFDVELPSDGAMTRTVEQAKRVCAECPVQRECLEYAFTTDGVGAPPVGDEEVDYTPGRFADVVFGGLTGRQRMSISQHEDRVDRGLAMFAYERLVWQLDSIRSQRRKEQGA